MTASSSTATRSAAQGTPRLTWWQRPLTWLLILLIRCFRHCPSWLAYGVADLLTPLVVLGVLAEGWLRPSLTRGLVRNSRIVFRGALERRHARCLLWAWCRHMTWLTVDFCRMARINNKNVATHVEMEEVTKAWDLKTPTAGLLCVTGHIGMFELLGHAAGLHGLSIDSVFRPIPFAPVHQIVDEVRASGGQAPHSKWGIVRTLLRSLEAGRSIGIAADENTKHRPIFAPFLGTLAATSRTPAVLHRATGAPLVVVSARRLGRERFRIHVWDVIRQPATDDEEADLQAITERMNKALGRAILAAPEQWFWSARRWRTRPAGELKDTDQLPPVIPEGVAGALSDAERRATLALLAGE